MHYCVNKASWSKGGRLKERNTLQHRNQELDVEATLLSQPAALPTLLLDAAAGNSRVLL